MANPIVLEDLERMYSIVGRRDRFEGSTIIVTGCAGFLGFYFLQFLVRKADDLGIKKVVGLDTFLLDKPKWLTDLVDEFPSILDLRAFDISKDDIATVDGAADARFVIHGASIASPTFIANIRWRRSTPTSGGFATSSISIAVVTPSRASCSSHRAKSTATPTPVHPHGRRISWQRLLPWTARLL